VNGEALAARDQGRGGAVERERRQLDLADYRPETAQHVDRAVEGRSHFVGGDAVTLEHRAGDAEAEAL